MKVSNCFGIDIDLKTKLSKVSSKTRKETEEGLLRLMKDHLTKSGRTIEDILGKDDAASILVEGAWKELSDIVRKPIELIKKAHGIKEGEESKLEELLETKYQGARDNYHVLNQEEAIKKNLNTTLQRFGLNVKLDKSDIIEQFNDRENDKAQRGSTYDVNHIEVDPKTLSKASVKFVMGTLRDEEYQNGVPTPTRTSLGLTKVVPFNKVQSTLLNTLPGISNIDRMFEKLDSEFLKNGKYKKGYLWIQQLKDEYKIGLPILNDSDVKNRIAFEVSNANTSLNIIKSVLSEGYAYFSDPLRKTNVDDVQFAWSNNAKNNTDTFKNDSFFTPEQGRMVVNRASKQYKDFINTKNAKTTEDILEKLKLIGIDFLQDSVEVEPYKKEIEAAYFAIAKQLDKAGSNISNFSDLFSSVEVQGRLNDLVDIYTLLNPAEKSNSFQNADGALAFATIHPSTASIILDGLNSTATLQDFKNKFPWLGDHNKYNTRSILLSPGGPLFDSTGKRRGKAEYTLISGTGMVDSIEGKNTQDLGKLDRVAQELNNILNSTYYIGINSDKSRELAISLPKDFISFLRISDEETIRKQWSNMLEDEMDAAFQEKISPSYIKGYHERVFQFGYFKDILSPKTVESFNREVIRKSTTPEKYEENKAAWMAKHFADLKKSYLDYIDSTANEYIDYLLQEGVIKQSGNNYTSNVMNTDILEKMFNRRFPGSATLSKLEMKNLSKFVNINYEIARQEQNKLFYGHPSLYDDAVKRLAMLHAPKLHFSQEPESLNYLQNKYPRLDGRNRETSRNIQFRAYKEQIYAQDGFHYLAEHLFNDLKRFQTDIPTLEEALGVRFTGEGKFKSYILDKDGRPTGQAADWLEVKGADSQVYSMPDHYWSFRIQSGNMNIEDWDRFHFERAYEIHDRSKRSPSDPAYKKYSSQLLKEAENTLDRYKNDKAFKKSVNSAVRGVYKPQYDGYSTMTGVTHKVNIKMAVKPLSWAEVQGTTWEDAYIHHQKQGDDMIGFPSAEKVGVVTDSKGELPSFYNESGEYTKNLPPLQELLPEFLGIQTEVPTEKRTVIGSQVLKIIMSNTDPIHYEEVKQYMSTLSDMYDHAGEMIKKKLGVFEENGEYYVRDVRQFLNDVRNKANGWGVSDNQIDSILAIKMKDGTYQLGTKFDALPSRERFENIFWGMVNRKLVNRELYGVPAVQVSDLGLEKRRSIKQAYFDKTTQTLVEVDPSTITPEQKKNLVILSSLSSIPHKGENGEILPAEITTVWHNTEKTPRQLGFEKGEDGLWRDKKNILPDEFYRALGFRIPTDSMGSILPQKIIAFFDPSEGDITARSSGQIVKDGSDFDVDKFNQIFSGIYEYNGRYFYNGDYKTPEELQKRAEQVWEYKEGRNFNLDKLISDIIDDKDEISMRENFLDGFKMQALQNKLLNHMSNIILAKENYTNLMTPISMGPLKKIAQLVLKAKGINPDENNTTKVNQLKFSQEARYTYLVQKKLVGMVARNATLHTMSQEHVGNIKLTGFYDRSQVWYLTSPSRKDAIPSKNVRETLRNSKIFIPFKHNKDSNNIPLLGKNRDVDGNLISSNISNSLQASVDGIKYPALAYLNINLYTMAQYQYLVNKGVSPEKSAALFFPQPILVEFTKEQDINTAMGTKVNDQNLYRKDLVWKVASKFYDNGKTYDSYRKNMDEVDALSEQLNNYDISKGLSYDDRVDLKARIKELRAEANETLMPMLSEISNYKSKITDLSEDHLIKGLKTSASSPKEERMLQASILFFSEEFRQQASQEFTLNNYLNIDTQKPKTFASDDSRDTLLNKLKRSNYVIEPEGIFNNTQLASLQKNLQRMDPIAKDYFIGATPAMKTITKRFLDKMDTDEIFMKGSDKEDLMNKYQNFAISRVLLTTPGEKGKMLLGDYQKLLFGTKSAAKTLARMKKKFPNSIALKALSFDIPEDSTKPSSIRLFKYNTDIYEINQITDSLLDLYHKAPDEESKEWIKNLGVYSIIQSGLQNTRQNIQRVLPTEVYSELVGKVLKTWENRSFDVQAFADLTYKQFHQLNVRNDSIVPKIKKYDVKDRTENETLIALDSMNYNAPHDFVKLWKPRNLTKEQKQINEENNQGYKNSEVRLYEKINKNDDNNFIWYKRVNILGEQGRFNEVYSEDFQSSLIPENGKFDELDPSYLTSVRIRTSQEKDVSLPMETKQGELFAEDKSNRPLKVVAGAQLGADMGGLDAALESGIKTGGTASGGFVQSTGKGTKQFVPELATKYGLKEGRFTEKQGQYGPYKDPYIQRTIDNAQEADGTIWFGKDSPGKTLTLSSKAQFGKAKPLLEPTTAQEIVDWVNTNNIRTINIAGNREYTNPGIYDRTKAILKEAFEILKKQESAPKEDVLSNTNIEKLYLEKYAPKKEEAPFDKPTGTYTLGDYMKDVKELSKKLEGKKTPEEIVERIKSCI